MKQPIAWAYEATEYADKTHEAGWKLQVSFEKPFDTTGGVRNIIPLEATSPDLLEALVVLENAARDPIDVGLLNHARAVARAAMAAAKPCQHEWAFHSRDGDFHNIEKCTRCPATRSVTL